MRMPLLTALAVGLLLGAGDAKEDAKKERKQLQGTWKVVTVRENGQSKDDAENGRLIFSSDEWSLKKGDETLFKGKFKAAPSKTPKQIDMEITEAQKEQFKGKTAFGIYELKGDELKWCTNKPGESERPKEFSSEAGGVGHFLVTFKREKP